MFEFTGGSVPTRADLQDRLEKQTGPTPEGTTWLNWVVRAGDEVVGVTQATVKEHGAVAEVAWEIGVPWQGHGYASEAAGAVVDWLTAEGVPDIRAHIHPDHTASARVARAAGLEPTDELDRRRGHLAHRRSACRRMNANRPLVCRRGGGPGAERLVDQACAVLLRWSTPAMTRPAMTRAPMKAAMAA